METREKKDCCREYLELCTGQMRCKAMRPEVEKELYAHIEEQTQSYLDDGMEREEAERLAVEQMGDPVETGTALDRIHRPKMDWKATGAILFLAAVGLLVQFMVGKDAANAGSFSRYLASTVLGIGLMFAVCFADYTILGKYPRLIWCVWVAAIAAAGMFGTRINGTVRAEWMIMLLVPFYAGIVFYYREQKGIGIIKALAWLMAACLVVFVWGPAALMGKLWLYGCFVMLGCAVAAGWYHVRRWFSLFIFGMPAAGVLGVCMWMLMQGRSYKRDRLLAFFNPEAYADGSGYLVLRIRDSFAGLHLFRGVTWEKPEEPPLLDWEDYMFLNISEKCGIAAGVLLIVLLFALAAFLFYRIGKQHNRLGVLTGIGCVMVFVIPVVVHPLMSAGLFFPTACALPFLSMNGRQAVGLYVLMGLLLSVFRGSAIRPEPDSRAQRHAMSARLFQLAAAMEKAEK